MRLLIYDPQKTECRLATELRTLVARRGWQAHWLAATRRVCGALDYREWVLMHEKEARSSHWQKVVQQSFDAFVGFGSASALLAAALPRSVRKIAVVVQLESERFVRPNAESHSVFHQRVEFDLLRTFDRVVAWPEVATLLAVEGLKDTIIGDSQGIEALLGSDAPVMDDSRIR